jgi:catecholate siderophore receptor
MPTPHALRNRLTLAVLAAIASPAVFAAEADAIAALGADAVELDRIRVVGKTEYHYVQRATASATRTETDLVDVPQSVTVVTRDLIDDTAMRGLADVVQYVPGAGIAQGEGHRDAPVLRGNTSTADLFVDGMRDDVQYFRDLYNVDRVEVLKGANALAFGRGGTGGVINRVTRRAGWNPERELRVDLGSWDRQRAVANLGAAPSDSMAVHVAAMAEDSGSFRDDVSLERFGINPSIAFRTGAGTTWHLDVEHFEDERVVDRGVPSRPGTGLPVDVAREVYFGKPADSHADLTLDAATLRVEHGFGGGALLRSTTRWARYDKFYQNVYPGDPVTTDALGSDVVPIKAYNNATDRTNLLHQTDLVWDVATGAVDHQFVAGLELGRQETGNLRQTGSFPLNDCNGATTAAYCVPLADPRYRGDVVFAPSATDADNDGVARTSAVFIQDQVALSEHWSAIAGVRFDRFDVDFRNNRNGTTLSRTDNIWSPRAAILYKPAPGLSYYASYARTFLPRAGEQLNGLSPSNAAFEPESYDNTEVGAKWDVLPELALTAAIYRLDRGNVIAPDPDDASRSILVDGERVEGFEFGVAGRVTDRWSVAGGFAVQDGEILQGGQRGNAPAHLPERTASLWNRFDITPRWGVGIGTIHRGATWASTSNAVRLKSYTRHDLAVFFEPTDMLSLQLNIENAFDKRYFASAHNDNNISPGTPRAAWFSATLAF